MKGSRVEKAEILGTENGKRAFVDVLFRVFVNGINIVCQQKIYFFYFFVQSSKLYAKSMESLFRRELKFKIARERWNFFFYRN